MCCNVYLRLKLRPTIESFFVSFLISHFKGVFYVTYKHVFVNFVWVLPVVGVIVYLRYVSTAFQTYFNQSQELLLVKTVNLLTIFGS